MSVQVSEDSLFVIFILCCMWLFRVPFKSEAKRDGLSDPGDDFYKDIDYLYNTLKSRYYFSFGIVPVGKIAAFYIIFYIIVSVLRLLIGLSEGR